jgi:hypothetical protein
MLIVVGGDKDVLPCGKSRLRSEAIKNAAASNP